VARSSWIGKPPGSLSTDEYGPECEKKKPWVPPLSVIPEAACGYPGSLQTEGSVFAIPDNAVGVSGMTIF
jgi:hypothetical protein